MRVELKLTRGRDAERLTSDAWFIPGADAGAWIAEILRWRVPQMELRVLVVATGDSKQPIGAVITGVPDSIRASVAQPYVRRAGRLLVPYGAVVSPFVSEPELTDLLQSDVIDVSVWHPVAGLIGFEASDMLTLADLLSVPDGSQRVWRSGDPGVRLNDHLRSVVPTQSLTLTAVMQQAAGDIGSESSLEDAPRSPDESSAAGLRDAVRPMITPFAHMVRWVTNAVPGTSDHRTWLDGLADWASRILDGGASQSHRDNELKRLLTMLRNNPDQGLRYAIPFGGEATRGLAAPSNQLGRRTVDFGANVGGGAADYWDMSWEMRQQLRQRYTELARREQKLGRHRRAAYIYAELLDDWPSAASVLESGQHHQEAAVVYRDRLSNERKAASCFEKAGQFDQAIELYEELEDWEAIAVIHALLNEPDQAREAWMKAIDGCRHRQEFQKAAKLCEQELDDPDAAADCLRAGWNSSNVPGECLKALFDLLGRAERTSEATKQIEYLLQQERGWHGRQAMAAGTLSSVAIGFPAETVRSQAADATRRIVARNLLAGNPPAGFNRALRALQPDDRLLIRDCDRFTRTKPTPKIAKRPDRVELIGHVSLRSAVSWSKSAYGGRCLYFAGYANDGILLARWNPSSEEGQPDYLQWYNPSGFEAPLLLAAANGHRRVFMHLVSTEVRKDFSRKASVFGKIVSSPPARTLAMAMNGQGTLCYLAPGEARYELRWTGSHDYSVAAFDVEEVLEPMRRSAGCDPLLATPGPGRAYLVYHRSCWIYSGRGSKDTMVDLPVPAATISPATSVDDRVAIGLYEGGLVVGPDSQTFAFGHGLVAPETCFTPQNDLIVADANGIIEVYRFERKGPDLVTTLHPRTERAIGVHSTPDGQFCVCYADGTVDVYRLNRG